MADKVEQLEMLNENQTTQTGPVTCLGMTFENDEARRAYFIEELRKKLPELRKIEGFPIGDDEDILALSNPPYYTVCPNPWINDFIVKFKNEGNAHEEDYHKEPYINDISIGRSGTIYNAHSYHTKVPHKAIMNFLLYYTNPGDVILDAFCGSGMTGVAAEMCGSKEEVISLGYAVKGDDVMDTSGNTISKIGKRHSILLDLSPTATSIASNYNNNFDLNDIKKEAKRLIDELEKECAPLLQTMHKISDDKKEPAEINFIVWSDNFICPECTEKFNFWDVAVDKKEKKVTDQFPCPSCKTTLTKKMLERAWNSYYHPGLGEMITEVSRSPVLINYTYKGNRFEKSPDEDDIKYIEELEKSEVPFWYPTDRIIDGDESRRNDRFGIKYVFQFYTKRNLWLMSLIMEKLNKTKNRDFFLGVLRSSTSYSTKMVKVNVGRLLNGEGLFSFGAVTGTLYVPSISGERPVFHAFKNKLSSALKAFNQTDGVVISTQSTTDLRNIESNSIDYIFIDPPFGSNLMYSELNFLWEAWIRVFTNNKKEAIVNNTHGKSLYSYKDLMRSSFEELARVLKEGRWITVEFSNSQASVWNAIQDAMQQAGFVIANVSALDKKQGSFKTFTTTTSVKQDLIISAYKPSKAQRTSIDISANTQDSAWSFLIHHLGKLPVFIGERGTAELIVERTPRILFDRMVSYHVQRGYPVPLSSAEFQAKIEQRFPMRDGMAFLESQVAEYDKKRILAKEFTQLSLFVSDENSAIEWLRQQLLKKPQTRQDLHPNFMKEIQHIAKHEMLPELDVLLEQNFLMYNGEGEVPSQIHAYLSSDYKDLRNLPKNDPKLIEKAKNRWYVPDPNKQADLEKLREKSLLREFNQYVEELSNSKKKLKQFRTEAIRVGFYKAWTEKNYQLIVDIGNRLPESILQEDEKLLRYYDNAQTKLGL
ncbi:DNA methylase [Paenibacillus barengoltzii]|uniref:DNA methyltransferase n=1 Tax=Paenibacillus barengoltzii TaxID=343517 RepID=UPI000A087CE3|nr:DNA methyltransferase [Paenibacillus barengoltzii]SME88279.1 DNA methylase [Paenibacillus barengoltzii]